MSAAPHDDSTPHEGPIRTPKQLVVAVVLAFVVPIAVIVLLANYVSTATKPGAGTDVLAEDAVAKRLEPVGKVVVKDASDVSALKTGEQVYTAVCAACHAAGVANSPKFGDSAAWAPRIKTGYDALLNSALKGKGAMAAQGGGDYSDVEIGRAVVHMANNAGGSFPVPAPAAAASAP
ncbi:c-type cytochrome [Aquariibacter albus]|uniref:Cytochrome c5 family protein n=1 Tax=Aquariibacter albus TaxID=2759899 RepID=A0A839HLZ2_9BURK|nr:c-type cytochrome [Aquariibacter albus]MBB1163293.1 cytochrome c5 family protein [Aquariibacter albus]